MKEIDCRGMACPQPVVSTKQALDQLKEGEMIVIVDNASSRDNVERFVRSQGCISGNQGGWPGFLYSCSKDRRKDGRKDESVRRESGKKSSFTSTLIFLEVEMRRWGLS